MSDPMSVDAWQGLDQLNANEVLDLVASVPCRGNTRDARFKP